MNVEIAEKRREAVRVFDLANTLRGCDLEAIVKALAIRPDFSGEKAARLDARKFHRPVIVQIFDKDAVGPGQEDADGTEYTYYDTGEIKTKTLPDGTVYEYAITH